MKAGVDYPGITTFFVCHDGDGKFLLHKRSQKCRDEQGRWDYGGGKLEFGETLEEGVMRELMEEHGCTGVIQDRLPITTRIREQDGKKTHWLTAGFVIQVDPKDVSIIDTDAIDEMGWFELGNFPEPLHSCAVLDIEENPELFAKYSK